MTEQTLTEATPVPATGTSAEPDRRDLAGEEAVVAEELLVEEISIDGMCGVY